MLGKVGAVAGAVAVALCWPLAVGQIGERIYQDTVGEYDSPYVEVTTESYDRGYLSSHAISKIALKSSWKDLFEEQGWPTEWHIAHDIRHGLFGLSSDSTLVVDDAVAPQVTAWWGSDAVPLTLKTTTLLTRKTDLSLTLNPFVYQDEEGNTFKSEPWTFTGEVSADGNGHFSYALKDAQLKTITDESMHVSGLQGGGQGRWDGGFWIGDQHLQLDKLRFTNHLTEQSVDLDTIKVSSVNTLMQGEQAAEEKATTNTTLNNRNQLSVSSLLSLDGKQYQNFNVDLLLADLNYDAVTRLSVMGEDLDGELTQEQAQDVILALDLLIAKGLMVNLKDISIEAPEGPVAGHVRLTVQPGLARASQNLSQISSKLDGEFYLEFPSVLLNTVEGMEAQTERLVQSGVLTLKEDRAYLSLKLEGDKVILGNGDQLPLTMFMSLLLS
ncbi:YdgA family protein [Photobacterium sp. CCB-ST2H9]|uniref:DUF945 family protein n=1 Tax=Photobacterium sp. CCB-ST2H9 TaxID=2912855 RepID=UPI002004EBB3|nr:DUF945 family protein [Photobacterium sp. CCB-ST2H9]UTM58268.1 YdgA family protein [Photobacterium sp. CCB-ST2H9]